MTRYEENARAQAQARERVDAASLEDAVWARLAREVRQAEQAAVDRLQRGRAEIVAHLLRPGALDAMGHARRQFEVDTSESIPAEIVWAPTGLHSVNSKRGIEVDCIDELGALAVEASRLELAVAGMRPAIDFEHSNGEPAGHISKFRWDPDRGILARVEWSQAGRLALHDRLFCALSPEFSKDRSTGRILGLVAGRPAASLTNIPAYGGKTAIWAVNGRQRAALLVREALLAAGHRTEQADSVAAAVKRGADTAAVRLMIETLSAW